MKKPTIKTIFNELEDGSRVEISSEDYFDCTSPYTHLWNTSDKERFFEERVAIEMNKSHYYCGECMQPVVIRGGKNDNEVKLHFRHKNGAPEDCMYEDDRQPSEEKIRAIKYKGIQESPLHERLKLYIASILENEDFRTDVEKTLHIDESHFRRPDVLAINYNTGQTIVFEIQMTTTFLHVVVERMMDYAKINHHVIWIFREFEPDVFTTKDTYQFQNNNVFVLDEEMERYSNKENKLHLKVFYLVYSDEGDNVPRTHWENKIVSLSDLFFDIETGVYYYDSKTSREEAISTINIRQREKERIEQEIEYEKRQREIIEGKRRDLNEALSKLETMESLTSSQFRRLSEITEFDTIDHIENLIKGSIKECPINTYNLEGYFQRLQLLNNLRIEKLEQSISYEIYFFLQRDWPIGVDKDPVWMDIHISDYPSICSNLSLLIGIYKRGYIPDSYEASKIEKLMRIELSKTQKNEIAPESFRTALIHFFLMKLSYYRVESPTDLVVYFISNMSFISCVVAITMRRFIEHRFNNLLGFCNYVKENFPNHSKAFTTIIDNCKIPKTEFISNKGVNHYERIRSLGEHQEVEPLMDIILHAIIPKVWK